MIKIDFEFETIHGKFADALHLPDDHAYSDEQIESMKQQRLDNWIALVTPVTAEETQQTIEINGEEYQLLTDVPPGGAKLIEVSGKWYFKL